MNAFTCKAILDEFIESKELTNDVIVAVSYMVRNKNDTTEWLMTWDKYKQIAEQMLLYWYIDQEWFILSD